MGCKTILYQKNGKWRNPFPIFSSKAARGKSFAENVEEAKKTAQRQLMAKGGSILSLSGLSGFPIGMAAINRLADPGNSGNQIARVVLQNFAESWRQK